ncbi:MAG: hypothetical protein KDA88_01490 [Planctomycetaceae bacterium]|nr:hypothetical protein [Planctomycetaceae bacterium]MCA9031488.1 hypothetical protein [Planctomycetaceae bacterium]MCB9950461.1 hypothetical protein [Planctomycetaceae bacterium]
MFSNPFPILQLGAQTASLEERVQRLEQALLVTLDSLQSVTELLERKFGHEALGSELLPLTSTSNADLEKILDDIGQLLKEGKSSVAARHIRDAFGCHWDRAHQLASEWNHYSREKKLRSLRLIGYIKRLEGS